MKNYATHPATTSTAVNLTPPYRGKGQKVGLVLGCLMAVVSAAVIIPIVMLTLASGNHSSQMNVDNKSTNSTSPNSTLPALDIPDNMNQNPYNDTAQANPFTPPLNEKFKYNTHHHIRGVNLGGWLVLEPFITPKIFEQKIPYMSEPIVDEWTLCKVLGPEEAKRQLQHHYETFITEEDFQKIAQMGFNHVRIPVGHWAINVTHEEPYVAHLSWDYLLRGIQWARKYGLRVMVELHTAPGSQNGWNHSGKAGSVSFLNGPDGDKNADRTLQIATEMIQFFNKPEWANVVTLFGVLNEPAMFRIPNNAVEGWYRKSYSAIRSILGLGGGPLLTYHDAFYPLKFWHGFFNQNYERVVLETHLYIVFNNDLVAMPWEKQLEFPCWAWKKELGESHVKTGPTMVGEFSVAINDCAKYLNGVGQGARYDGTLQEPGAPKPAPICPTCNCKDANNWPLFSTGYKQFLLQFMEKQMDAYEASIGWFYWTYKTEDHVNPHWDYLLAWEQGFAPKDVNLRNFTCPLNSPGFP
ncbi:glycoside hydrolase superfamily [Mycotypha africana]|uniref:glycoside hydrolase superfamily n=1 Tax=Mycotypha africana TaxID=64632 RepID=UPI002300210B|nr:glycoside hydrolase superfamily [Mycotypha africana]KAI8991661.1 glycoside hydrolase superfamily [Mycotypha africana]